LEAYKTRMAPMMPRREAEAREAAARLKGRAGT
ncbi:MAG: DJ-1/PfpI family protein, partial [Phenylobacterium sp.]|nr:DJ-1/PfpI family protein [Phenylobacterium sp.]